MRRELEGKQKHIIYGICILLVLFQIYTTAFGPLPDISQAAVHFVLVSIICFALWPATKAEAKKKKIPIYDIVLMWLVVVPLLYAAINHYEFVAHPYIYTTVDIVLAGCLILGVFEAARRTLGWVLPILAISLIIYSLATGSSLTSLLIYLYHQDLGMWGLLTDLMATLIAMFLIFGSFLLFSGGGDTFIEIAKAVGGKYKGGPAKVAVLASGSLGMLVGSPVSNVATTGPYTIPLMKKTGYAPEVAGAVEAVASTGGMLVPPIMGAGAFIMAELLGIPYLRICLYAVIPALLHYIALFLFVHFEAVRLGGAKSDLGGAKIRHILTWARLGPLVIPIAIFIGLLLEGFSVTFSCLYASLATLICFTLKDLNLSAMTERLKALGHIFTTAGRTIASIAPLLVCAQIVVSMLGETGLGVTMAGAILIIGESFKPLAVLLAAVLCIILGMGIPPAGAYVLAVAITAPALARLGVLLITTHMFCFTFGTFAAITPPVCAAVYVAADIAKANWLKTGFNAVRIAVVTFTVPFSYVLFKPYLLGIGPIELVLVNFVLASIGACFIASFISGAFFTGRVNPLVRLCFGAGGFLIFVPFAWPVRILGAGLVALGLVANKFMPVRTLVK